MPTVVKQSPRDKPSRKSGVLGRIAPVKYREGGFKVCIYGRGKTGKTRLACTFPKPLLLIGTEDGTKSVSNVKGVDFVMLDSSDDLVELVELLKEGKYKSAVLDTAGGFQDIILKEVLGLDEVPVSKFKKAGKGEAWGITDRATWGTVGTQFKERMRMLLNLSQTQALNIVCIAHERNFNDDNERGDVIFPTIGAALTPSAAGWLNAACDYICQTFIREEVTTKSIKIAGKLTTTSKRTGKMEYCLRTGPHDIYMTGFRVPKGTVLPDVIVDADYEKIAALVAGKG